MAGILFDNFLTSRQCNMHMQGMDEANERRLLQVVFHGCSPEENTRQYIIVTPKILKAMDYPEHVLVHTVYNGAQIHSSPGLSFHEQIKELRAKRQRLG
jgi:hypothetical protein